MTETKSAGGAGRAAGTWSLELERLRRENKALRRLVQTLLDWRSGKPTPQGGPVSLAQWDEHAALVLAGETELDVEY